MAEQNLQKIRHTDQLIFDEDQNLVGIKNPKGHGEDFLPVRTSADGTSLVSGDGTAIPPTITADRYIGVFGDSINAFESSAAATSARGPLAWAKCFSKGAFKFDNGVQYGTAGNQTVQMLARIDTAIAGLQASGTSAVFISAGVNDPLYYATTIPGGVTSTVTNLVDIMQRFLNAGIYPIWRELSPQSSASWTAAGNANGVYLGPQINARMAAALRGRKGMYYHRTVPVYLNTASTTNDPASGTTSDGLHPVSTGAFVEGKLLWQEMTTWFQFTNTPKVEGLADNYNETYNTAGNLLNGGAGASYGALPGSQALSGTGFTGNFATGLAAGGGSISRLTGSAGIMTGAMDTAAVQTIAGIDSGRTYRRQKLTFSSCDGTDSFQWAFVMANNATFRNLVAGDRFMVSVDVDCASNVANLVTIEALGLYTPAVAGTTGMSASSRTDIIPAASQSWTVESPPITVPASQTGFLMAVKIYGTGGAALAGDIYLSNPRVVKLL